MRILSIKVSRSQSAMEYLMTYGWSILIIAVVLGAMFQLGVFNSANLGPRAPTGNCKVLRVAGTSNLEGTCSGVLPQSVAQFDGVSSSVSTGTTGLPTGSSARSVFAWIYTPTPTPLQYIYQYGARSGDALSGFTLQSGLIGLTTYNHGGASGLPSLSANAWHFVGFIYSGGTYVSGDVTFYLDGQSSTVWTNPTTPATASGNSIIGAYAAGADYFNGQISNVQVYNTSLDQNQITALYLKGIGAAPIDPNHIVGWWPLNGDTNDYSGNNNNGAPTGVLFTGSWARGYTPP
jgi:Concanavalin A-like lectin/glucanases superfamily